MTNMFKSAPPPAPAPPTPIAPPPMPDPSNPAALEAAKVAARARAGRSATILTTSQNRPTLAAGGTAPYAGTTLGG